ncbi:MAG: ISAzo13 family transposase, partial [Acidimicrobiia bacterium]
MIVPRYQQRTIYEGMYRSLIPDQKSILWEEWMLKIDRILEDDELVELVHDALGRRRGQSRTRGRKSTPSEVVLRLMVLKHMKNWSYATLEREVRANLLYRDFTRIGGEKVPDEKTLVRLAIRILQETTAGDPMSPLRWTSKSTRTIAKELSRRGHAISNVTVARCLHELDYSLQANVKTREGSDHPNRDAQFRYINARVKEFLRTGDPVISVDTKKKELVGAFKNAGRTWRPKGKPHEVNVHDFIHLGRGKAIPYGTYDIARDRAVVNVGITHDTAEFAVESIRRWWRLDGRHVHGAARRLLICADSGGSNGARVRAWKVELQTLAADIG